MFSKKSLLQVKRTSVIVTTALFFSSQAIGDVLEYDVEASDSTDITLSISSVVSINGLSPIDLGTWTGSDSMETVESFCIYTNTTSYSISASGNDGTAFALSDGSGSNIPYDVYFVTSIGQSGTAMTKGSALANNSPSSDPSCSIDTVSLRVVADTSGDFDSSSSFTDTLTLTVSAT